MYICMLPVVSALVSTGALKVQPGCRPSTNATVRSAAVTQAGDVRAKNQSFCARCTLPGETSPQCVSAMYAAPKGSGGIGFFLGEPDHEVGIVNLFLTLLARQRYPQRRPVFFDIGMNSGFFSNLMAARGAEVHAFETQPNCFDYASSALAAAGLWPGASYEGYGRDFRSTAASTAAGAPSVFLYNAGLTDSAGAITQSNMGCDGSNKALTQASSSLRLSGKARGGGQKRVPTFVLDDSMGDVECAPQLFAVKTRGRLGGATAGHHGLRGLHRQDSGCPPHSGGEAHAASSSVSDAPRGRAFGASPRQTHPPRRVRV